MKITWGQGQFHELVTSAPCTGPCFAFVFCTSSPMRQWGIHGLGTWILESLISLLSTTRGWILDFPLPCPLVPWPALTLLSHTCPMTTATPQSIAHLSPHPQEPPLLSSSCTVTGKVNYEYTYPMPSWERAWPRGITGAKMSQNIWRVNGGSEPLAHLYFRF